jgi:hypothetical protein
MLADFTPKTLKKENFRNKLAVENRGVNRGTVKGVGCEGVHCIYRVIKKSLCT